MHPVISSNQRNRIFFKNRNVGASHRQGFVDKKSLKDRLIVKKLLNITQSVFGLSTKNHQVKKGVISAKHLPTLQKRLNHPRVDRGFSFEKEAKSLNDFLNVTPKKRNSARDWIVQSQVDAINKKYNFLDKKLVYTRVPVHKVFVVDTRPPLPKRNSGM